MFSRFLSICFFPASVVFSLPAAAQLSVARICDSCSAAEQQECAVMMAQYYGLKAGDQTLILDPADGEAASFLIQVGAPDAGLEAGTAERGEADHEAATIQVKRQSLTPEQAEASQALSGLIREADARDAMLFDAWSCGPHLLDAPELAPQRRAELQQRQKQRKTALHMEVAASSGHDSVRSLLGQDDAAVALAGDTAPPAEVLAVDARGDSAEWPNATLRLKFADGSQGIWRLDTDSGQWAPDWSLFHDPDGNRIPMTADDMPIGTGYTFTSRANLEWFVNHSAALGIPVDRQDGEASSVICVRDYRRLLCQPGASQG